MKPFRSTGSVYHISCQSASCSMVKDHLHAEGENSYSIIRFSWTLILYVWHRNSDSEKDVASLLGKAELFFWSPFVRQTTLPDGNRSKKPHLLEVTKKWSNFKNFREFGVLNIWFLLHGKFECLQQRHSLLSLAGPSGIVILCNLHYRK